MELRHIMLMILMIGAISTGLFIFVGSFHLSNVDPAFNTLTEAYYTNLSTYGSDIGINMSSTLTEGSTEAVNIETEEVSMIKSGYKVLKMTLKTPQLIHTTLIETFKILGIPPAFFPFIYGLFLIILTFLVLSVITRIKT